MTRRCSHCSNNGHNSRTCPTRGGVKLFGVRLTDGSIKKSASMGNLSAHYYSSSSAAASPNQNPGSPDHFRDPPHRVTEGYASDDPVHASCSSNCRSERKKGIPWTEEEHRLFLMGLQKLGKGDWRGIARNFVVSRTPTQVASHAQKYFIRQTNATRRKRRSSLFDMIPNTHPDAATLHEEPFLPSSETANTNSLPSLNLSLDRESDHMDTTTIETAEETVTCPNFAPIPVFFPTYLPVPFPFWTSNLAHGGEEQGGETSNHQVLKPTPVFSKDRSNVDEILGMSKLTLGARIEPSQLTLELLGAPSRQSAFHANQPGNRPDLSKSKSNAIHAV